MKKLFLCLFIVVTSSFAQATEVEHQSQNFSVFWTMSLVNINLLNEKKRIDVENIYNLTSGDETNEKFASKWPFDEWSLISIKVLRRKLPGLYVGGDIYEVKVYSLDKYGQPTGLLKSYNTDTMKITYGKLTGSGSKNATHHLPVLIQSNDTYLTMSFVDITTPTTGGGAQGGITFGSTTSKLNASFYSQGRTYLTLGYDSKIKPY